MKMRPQTTKANMRDMIRRSNKNTHSVRKEKRRRKKTIKRRQRNMIRKTIPTRDTLCQRELGEQEGKVVCSNNFVSKVNEGTLGLGTTVDVHMLVIDELKEKNIQLQNYVRFLLWRINDQERKDNKELETMNNVRICQARHIRSIEAKLRDLEISPSLQPKDIKFRDIIDLAGIAC